MSTAYEIAPQPKPHVLLIDDDPDLAFAVGAVLAEGGARLVTHVSTAADAWRRLGSVTFDVIIVDLHLPDADGFTLLEELAAAHPGVGLLCFTGRDDARAAVKALRAGAWDYMTKPAPAAILRRAVDAITARAELRARSRAHPSSKRVTVGAAPAWRSVMALVEAAARSPKTTVLVRGEPGVGKEEIAALVHEKSPRREGPYVTVNAACLSPTMIESELFGHEAGAFTGAVRLHRGLFEQAHGGTLFLDEIGELPLELQARLLRVLEGHPFRRVGGERPVTVDARLVCATNRDLEERVRAGAFRADLFERLRVFELLVPPLRERPGDISRLAHHFVARLGPELGFRVDGLSPEALDALERYHFPGNVRELRNIIERAIVLADGGIIERRHLVSELRAASTPAPRRSNRPAAQTLEDVVRDHILRVYERTNHNVTQTARILDMSRLAVRRRLQSYGVRERSQSVDDEERHEDDR